VRNRELENALFCLTDEVTNLKHSRHSIAKHEFTESSGVCRELHLAMRKFAESREETLANSLPHLTKQKKYSANGYFI
jgi:hypothetical protein